MTHSEMPERESGLTGNLLKSVSRSFYLSLRLLPAALREPVSLAYLLARATDTLADTTQVPGDVRRQKLKALATAIDLGDDSLVRDLPEGFAGWQTDPAEKELIAMIPESVQTLTRLPEFDRAEIRTVLQRITRAQELDLERFGEAGTAQALESAAQLDEYTYLIAGCVGEFWTEMCFAHLARFSQLPKEEMRALGRDYGCGLQLVNVLRDMHSDLRAGRCYLPGDELASAGLSAGDVLARPEAALPVIERWLSKAESGMVAGMKYVDAIDHRRVRIATALPALIGIKTIRELRAAGGRALHERIKIPRNEVRQILMRSALALGSRAALRQMFAAA